MGAGASVAHELASAPTYGFSSHNRHSTKSGQGASPVEMQYNEMIDHLRHVSEARSLWLWQDREQRLDLIIVVLSVCCCVVVS